MNPDVLDSFVGIDLACGEDELFLEYGESGKTARRFWSEYVDMIRRQDAAQATVPPLMPGLRVEVLDF